MSVLRRKILVAVSAAFFAGSPRAALQSTDSTLATVEGGQLRGATSGAVISWKAIPYAAPPVGALRWRAPQTVKPWTGVRPANAFGPECMQLDEVPKSEDCLTLNVWRPASSPTPLPAMVWIYGGALVHGSTRLLSGRFARGARHRRGQRELPYGAAAGSAFSAGTAQPVRVIRS